MWEHEQEISMRTTHFVGTFGKVSKSLQACSKMGDSDVTTSASLDGSFGSQRLESSPIGQR